MWLPNSQKQEDHLGNLEVYSEAPSLIYESEAGHGAQQPVF